jgi:hypothetical protein
VALTITGCRVTGAAGAGGSAVDAVASDTALFAAVLQSVEPFREGLLHVDPRPLRATPPQESARSEEALAAVGDEVVRARDEVLHRLGIPVTDALRDSRCAFVHTEDGSGWRVLEVEELYRVYSSSPRRYRPFASSGS